MRRVFTDFHVHSCLSPCGDDAMTPALAAGLLKLAGYDVAALTDHNAVGNCPAFFRACESYGLTPLAGMELTTAEDIHLVCLLRNYKGEKFDLARYVDPDAGFISSKSFQGRELKALELPGLWNGAMSNWNTQFVEVPAATFNPVKVVLDLLKPAHNPLAQ